MTSTAKTLEVLVRSGVDVVGVLGYESASVERVSGWRNLRALAANAGIDFIGFRSINHPDTVAKCRELRPDVLFVVGLSQLLGGEILRLPSRGTVGFHPTALPKGRGRAPIAWMVLEQMDGAATFFEIGEGIDDGPIFVQEHFSVGAEDDASTVERKILESIELALGRWLPDLLAGKWEPTQQNESEATWYGKRTPEDGRIFWQSSAEAIVRLVRASTKPHPGAYCDSPMGLVRVWAARADTAHRHRGTVGSVLHVSDHGVLVQAGDLCVWLLQFDLEGETRGRLQVGDRLGDFREGSCR